MSTIGPLFGQLRDLMVNNHLDSSGSTSLDCLHFLSDVIQLASTPEMRSMASLYGKKLSLIWSTCQGARFQVSPEASMKLVTAATPKEKKAAWLRVAYNLTFVCAGVEAMKNAPTLIPVPSLLTDDAPLSVFSPENLDLISQSVTMPATLAFTAFNFWNLISETNVMHDTSLAGTTAEKVVNVSGFLSSGLALVKVGASLAGLSVAATTLGVACGTLGSLRFFASREHAAEVVRSPLLGVKKELVQVVNDVYREAAAYAEKHGDPNMLKENLEDLKEVCDICKYRIKSSDNEETLDKGVFIMGLFVLSLKSSGVSESLAGRFDVINEKYLKTVEDRHVMVAEKKQLLQDQKSFLDRSMTELNRELESMEGEFGDIISSYKRSEILEMQARILEDSQKIDNLLLHPPVEIVITSWVKDADYLCSGDRRKDIATKIEACKREPELFEVLRI